MATGDTQPTTCIAASLPCWVLGVPGHDASGSWRLAEDAIRVEVDEEDEGEEEGAEWLPSLRGCSWRMDN